MTTSNTPSTKDSGAMLTVVLSAIFLLAMLILLLWFMQPAFGYSAAPYTNNPTAITVGR